MNSQAAMLFARHRTTVPCTQQTALRRVATRPRPIRYIDLASIPAAGFSPIGPSRDLEQFASRMFDIVSSLVLLIIVAPLMACLAVLIRFDSKGPAIYRQERLGLNGKPFTLLKFRSMRVDAEAAGPAWASLRDPRVTRLGGFLRLTRLDELPQLWNVLKGDMAMIGPRPERPHFVEQLSAAIPHFRARMSVKPGLTGWAQVYFRYGASIEDSRMKLAYDLYYVQNRNFAMNVRIVLGTIKVMFCKEGR